MSQYNWLSPQLRYSRLHEWVRRPVLAHLREVRALHDGHLEHAGLGVEAKGDLQAANQGGHDQAVVSVLQIRENNIIIE